MGLLDFIFRKRNKKINRVESLAVNLKGWERLKKLPDTYVYDICKYARIEDIAVALKHSDRWTVERFLRCSDLHNKQKKLRDALSSVTAIELTSNRMKAYLVNTYLADEPGRIKYEPYDQFT